MGAHQLGGYGGADIGSLLCSPTMQTGIPDSVCRAVLLLGVSRIHGR